MAHTKRKRTENKKSSNRSKHLMRAGNAASKMKRKKEKWAKDEKYQASQKTRQEELKNKKGYVINIEDGIRNKKRHKEEKVTKLKRLKAQARNTFKKQ